MTSLEAALTESRSLGFLGPGPVEPHIHHSAAFARSISDAPARALDLGAGGGLPGLVLAARHWPDARWTFLDAQAKRTSFLEQQVEALGLDAVEVVNARAEDLGRDPAHRGRYDLVVSRSFGPPAVTAECSAPLLRPGGWLVVSEPPDGDVSDRWSEVGLSMVGLGAPEPLSVETEVGPVHLVRTRLVEEPDDRYPRRVGVPAKRPLF